MHVASALSTVCKLSQTKHRLVKRLTYRRHAVRLRIARRGDGVLDSMSGDRGFTCRRCQGQLFDRSVWSCVARGASDRLCQWQVASQSSVVVGRLMRRMV